MNHEDFETVEIGNRIIVIKGIGKMFYQEGFPLSLAITMFSEKGMEVSLFHVADELIKTGDFGINKRGESTAFKRLSESLSETINGDVKPKTSIQELEKFCFSSYEDQREMIFKYLFGENPYHKELTKVFLKTVLPDLLKNTNNE